MNFQPTSMKEKAATDLLSTQVDQGVTAIQFTKVDGYTTFVAEHAFDGPDIVFHFYRTEENDSDSYWKETFPNHLSKVAQEVFQAEYPRLKAAFTEEKDSWWMLASGFGVVGLPEERVLSFYEKLDCSLDQKPS